MTRMACPDLQYEEAFVQMLDEVNRYGIREGKLTFYDGDRALATFRSVDPAAMQQ